MQIRLLENLGDWKAGAVVGVQDKRGLALIANGVAVDAAAPVTDEKAPQLPVAERKAMEQIIGQKPKATPIIVPKPAKPEPEVTPEPEKQ